MKSPPKRNHRLALLALGLSLAAPGVRAQHINAGALSANQGSSLYFANGSGFINTSGYVQNLTFTNSGPYAGFFQSSGPTFTSLARTTNNGATPNVSAAAFGAFLQLRLETVTAGPSGGSFSFWEGGASAPTLSLAVGQINPTGNLLPLSDVSLGAGTAGADPFGHLHGRRYTATVAGDYTVGFRIVDTSVNGIGGGPIHVPSDMFYMTFRAVPEPSVLALSAMGLAGLGLVAWRSRRKPNP